MAMYKVTYRLPVKQASRRGQNNNTDLISVSNYFNEKGLQDFIKRTPICVGPIMINVCKKIESN